MLKIENLEQNYDPDGSGILDEELDEDYESRKSRRTRKRGTRRRDES